MNTCGTCKFWQYPRVDYMQVVEPAWVGDRDERMATSKARYEAANEADKLYGHCDAIRMGPTSAGEPLPLAQVLDGSRYMANLFTLPDFGCVLWQAKDEGDA